MWVVCPVLGHPVLGPWEEDCVCPEHWPGRLHTHLLGDGLCPTVLGLDSGLRGTMEGSLQDIDYQGTCGDAQFIPAST